MFVYKLVLKKYKPIYIPYYIFIHIHYIYIHTHKKDLSKLVCILYYMSILYTNICCIEREIKINK